MRVPDPLRVSLFGPERWDEVVDWWRTLYANDPSASVFVSEEWVSTWLEMFRDHVQVQFCAVHRDSQPVGLCLLSQTKQKLGPFTMDVLAIGTTGEPIQHSVYVEANGMLCQPGEEEAVAEALAGVIRGLPWDHFEFPRAQASKILDALRRQLSAWPMTVEESPTVVVDLAAIQPPERSIEETLSKQLRKQLRQTVRLYEEFGPVTVQVAGTVAEAHALFQEMAALNIALWTKRGMGESCFTSSRFIDFHELLIARTHGLGGTHLVKVSAGDRTVGILYAIGAKGMAFAYQSGLDVPPNNRMKPGYLCRIHAADALRHAGMERYDLMGDAPHKRDFSNHCEPQITLTVRRPTPRVTLIHTLRMAQRKARRLLRKR